MGSALRLQDFLAMYDEAPEGVHYEVVDGRAILRPTPTLWHQRTVGRLFLLFNDLLPPDLVVLVAPCLWVLWENPTLAVRQPDLVLVSADESENDQLHLAPELVVEVLSPETRAVDLRDKRTEYAQAGAEHYWVVDIETPAIEALTLDPGTGDYRTAATATGDTPLTVTAPFPVRVVPADLVRKGGGPWAPKATRH